jgi:hypothetical protein
MKFGSSTAPRPRSKRERLMQDYTTWQAHGRSTPPTASLLAGMFAVLYRKRHRMLPISPVQDDIEHFSAMLHILAEDPTIAPYCVEVLCTQKEFNVCASAFSNSNILEKWSVIEKADKLRIRNGSGEQAEFKSDTKHYGVTRV